MIYVSGLKALVTYGVNTVKLECAMVCSLAFSRGSGILQSPCPGPCFRHPDGESMHVLTYMFN